MKRVLPSGWVRGSMEGEEQARRRAEGIKAPTKPSNWRLKELARMLQAKETPQQARLRVQATKSEEKLQSQFELAVERKKYWEWREKHKPVRRRKDG